MSALLHPEAHIHNAGARHNTDIVTRLYQTLTELRSSGFLRSVITQKSAVLTYFAAEAQNHP